MQLLRSFRCVVVYKEQRYFIMPKQENAILVSSKFPLQLLGMRRND